ncbi:helix-turn-helix domain-containing protein [Pseudomonas sp. o96-267]|uniref:helix-turn-helix domain-containing protein n=1 Tax=Pseudomonas sp. o96-267 TaxID=2479853 RepID=UPI000F77FCC5|nr:S24 family peptidase [Pseudomonas sp. o96-267]RRV29631.1 helix-turn-helix domain-containing protein [Pseudomonas sp. o96-267]
MKIGTTVRAARKAKGMTLEQLAHEIGTDAGNLSRFERGLQGAGQDVLERMLSILNIQISSEELDESNVGAAMAVRGQVPLISWIQAGCWSEVSDIYAVGDAEQWLPCPVSHGPRTYALRVRGLSMYNPAERHSFNDGDIIFVDPDRAAIHRSLIVAKLTDTQEATFKQLLIEGDQRFLMALNPSWPNRIFPINGNAEICGVAIAKHEPLI